MSSREIVALPLALLVATTCCAQIPSAADLKLWKEHTVMIETPHSQGAGILVRMDATSAMIVTANHVVRQPETRSGSIKVRFFEMQGDYPARVDTHFSPEADLDLAVLHVAIDEATARRLYNLSFRILPPAERQPSPGQNAYPLGYPLNDAWRVATSPCVLANAAGRLTFESCPVLPGGSGGGMFSADGYLLGIVTNTSMGYQARVSEIRQVVAQLERWGLKTQLQDRVSVDAAADGSPQAKVLRSTIEVAPYSNSRFLLSGNSGYRRTGSGSLEYSTDGKTFQRYTKSLDLKMGTPPMLIVRELDPSGKELIRLDKTAFLKTELTRLTIENIAKRLTHDLSSNWDTSWGCDLYGCRFNESYGDQAFCSAAVTRASLSESMSGRSFEIDRTSCKAGTDANSSGPVEVCAEFPQLPFAVVPGKTLYAKFEFIDGTTHIEPLVIHSRALARAIRGNGGDYSGDLEHWTVLTPVSDTKGQPAPFAAIAFQPSGSSVGGYFLFVGIDLGVHNCARTTGRLDAANASERWLSNINGTGFSVAKMNGHSVDRPAFGPMNGESLSQERLSALTKTPTELEIAVTSSQFDQLGPYKYRFDPIAPVVAALRRLRPPRIECERTSTTGPAICAPGDMTSFVNIKEVRFGRARGKWSNTFSIDYPAQSYLANHFRVRTDGAPTPFHFEVPHNWPEAFVEIVEMNGQSSTRRLSLDALPMSASDSKQ